MQKQNLRPQVLYLEPEKISGIKHSTVRQHLLQLISFLKKHTISFKMTLNMIRGGCRAQKGNHTIQGNLQEQSVLGLTLPTASMYHSREERPLKPVQISLQTLSST